MKRWTLALVLLGLAELAAHRLTGRAALLVPAPSAVLRAAWTLTADGTLLRALLGSVGRVGAGVTLAAVFAVPLGLVVGASRRLGAVLDAPLRVLRPIPPVAWVPLSMLWLGVTELQQVSVLAFAAGMVLATGTARAAAAVPPDLVFAARNLGADDVEVLRRVHLPATLPGVLHAVRDAVGTAWFVLVAAELLAGSPGLGLVLLQGRDLLDPARSFVAMGLLAACGAVSDRGLAALEARVRR